MIVAEYWCPHHERFELIEPVEAQDARPCPTCGVESAYVISAPSVQLKLASVERGSSDSSPPPGHISTSLLADGMKRSEWKRLQRDRRRSKIRGHIRSKI